MWDKYLKDARVVVSTYQVLFDAIAHGFVRFDRLSLLVLDEGMDSFIRLLWSKSAPKVLTSV